MIAWILFGAMLVLHAAAFALAMCYTAKRGDEAMEDYFKSLKHPTSNIQRPTSNDQHSEVGS